MDTATAPADNMTSLAASTGRRAHATLPTPPSLRGAVLPAAAKGEPLVVMTTLKGCPFCEIVRDHHLGPMVAAGQVYAIQVDILDRRTSIQDFDGRTTTPSELALRWNARFAPTVLFFDRNGKEVAERLQGVAVADFYGDYLEQRLSEARRKLR